MNILEIILIGIGLSMDAVAISISNGMVCNGVVCAPITKRKLLAIPVFFGVFQGIMPILGYYTGGVFSQLISKYSCVLIFLILGMIGAKMLIDAFFKKDEQEVVLNLTYKLLFFQAIATSIDAFAVGVAFSTIGINIIVASIIIALTTFVCSWLAVSIGEKCGDMLGNKAEIFGGIILLLIAIKAIV